MADEREALEVDWCARAAQLRQVETALLSGEMVEEARFGSDMARYSKASLSDVQSALNLAIRNCQLSRGEKPKRRRFAMRGLMTRPY